MEDFHIGDHHNYDFSNESAVERRPTAGRETWIDMLTVPLTPPAPAAYPGGPVVGNVSGLLGVPLAQVVGNPYRYSYQGGGVNRFTDMVPANYSGGAYEPTLRDSANAVVPYDPSVWVADGLLGVVEFKYRTPQELGYMPPFTIDYWQYRGAFAGSGILANDGSGAQVYEIGTLAPSMLRTLVPDPGAGRGGIVITQNPSEIYIGNTLTGANVGGGAGIFRDKTTNVINMRTLVAAVSSGLTLTPNADDVTISAAGGGVVVTALANVGVGTGLAFSGMSGNTANLRTLLADTVAANSGIAINTVGLEVVVGNTLTGNNLSTTVGRVDVFTSKTAGPARLNFRSLVAGANVLITPDVPGIGDITIAAGAAPPATPGTVWVVRDVKASGVGGGNFSPLSTWLRRDLNTLTSFGPAPANVTLAANQLTMQPGVYMVTGHAPAFGTSVSYHQARLQSITGAVTLAVGGSMALGSAITNLSCIQAVLNIAAATVVELQHWRSGPGAAPAVNGFGQAVGAGLSSEIYSSLTITQLA